MDLGEFYTFNPLLVSNYKRATLFDLGFVFLLPRRLGWSQNDIPERPDLPMPSSWLVVNVCQRVIYLVRIRQEENIHCANDTMSASINLKLK